MQFDKKTTYYCDQDNFKIAYLFDKNIVKIVKQSFDFGSLSVGEYRIIGNKIYCSINKTFFYNLNLGGPYCAKNVDIELVYKIGKKQLTGRLYSMKATNESKVEETENSINEMNCIELIDELYSPIFNILVNLEKSDKKPLYRECNYLFH